MKYSGAHPIGTLFGRDLYLKEPADWSNGLFYGKEPAWFHTASKFLGGQALAAILTAGASQSGLFCKLSRLWGGAGCFTGDTGVVTGYNPDGTYHTTPIADVRVGDYVLSRDQDDPAGPVELEEVTGVERHEVYALQDVTVTGLDGQPETIQTTAGHPFYVEGQGWTDAGALSVGEHVELPDGTWATVTANAAEAVPGGVAVYNLTVDGDHTYFVNDGGAAVWVHNSCSGDSRKLRAALKVGEEFAVGEQATHLIPSNMAGRSASIQKSIDTARRYLAKSKIGINDAVNGFRALPGHLGTHTDEYLKIIDPKLKAAYEAAGSDGVRTALQNLKTRVLSGEFISD